MKREIISQIKSELHMLEVSSLPHEFEKHLYAVETLVSLLKAEGPGTTRAATEEAEPDLTDKDKKMLEMMGGSKKEGRPPEEKRTDNSIFDF
ncbi:DUF5327 family protein [Salinicoccus kekensis]|uniref:YwdI family protein n=1 Tax=Salinicoccus kekensis TaxID=714307 RepID=A0A285UMD7_9STAP|nr:DUF5327 family protein [Salinicoccus kekensis]SOC43030.1 hypothetical protein SAMN05878391_1841 [Salinicoccus kekensis]